jgi:uncharacterized protein (TIRG00374 family)
VLYLADSVTIEDRGGNTRVKTERKRQWRSRLLGWAINLFGILGFALILYLGGVEAWQQVLGGNWRYVLAALGVTGLWNLLAAYRWATIARQMVGDRSIPYRHYFTYHMIGMFAGQVVPITVGMLGGRPVALSLSQGVRLRRAALSVFLDKIFDLALALLLAVPAVFYLVDWISLPLALGLMGATAALGSLLVAWKYEEAVQLVGRLGSRLAQPLGRLPLVGRRLVQRLPQQLDRLANGTFLPNRLALRAYLMTLVMYSLLAARLFFVAQALRLEIPWYLLAMGICVTQLALVFSVTPGSLGFLEGGWAAVLGLGGIGLESFTTFVIGRRAYLLVFTLLYTLLAFAWIGESPARLFRQVYAASRQSPQETGQDASPAQPEALAAGTEAGTTAEAWLEGQPQARRQIGPD